MKRFWQNGKNVPIPKKQMLAVGIVAVLFLVTLIAMECTAQRHVLRIQGTGRKDEVSFGTDIRIMGIWVNGGQLTSSDVKLKGRWQQEGDILIAIGTDESTWVEIPFRDADQVKVTFWKQCGSGYISIKKDGVTEEEWNLYSPELEYVDYTVEKTAQITPLQTVLPFAALLQGLLLEGLLLHLLLQRWTPKKKRNVPQLLLLALGAAVVYVCVELINGGLKPIGLALTLENMLIYFTMMLAVYVVTARVSWSVSLVAAGCLVFAVANYYVTAFRGSPIAPGDFYTLQTAANVAGNYQYVLSGRICRTLVGAVLALSLVSRLAAPGKRPGRQVRVVLCVPVLALGLVILRSDLYSKTMDLWNVKGSASTLGLGVHFVSSIHNMRVEHPENYSAGETRTFLEQYAREDNGFRPNVIVIMNESFSDLSTVLETMDSNLYMPYFNSLQENTVRGTAVSSVRGGLTSNSEYEFLTGNTMYFLTNQVPYQQYIYHDAYSLVGVLEERGYASAAIHPYLASGYNRPGVYSRFGFDEFVTVDDFSDCELVRNLYISDGDSYRKVIQVFEQIRQTGAPAFIFNVTMQNHSGYQTGYFGEDVIRVPGMEGQFPEVEEYLTLMRKSDEALPILIDYFSRREEPVVILFFGDHQPAIGDEFYFSAKGRESWDFTLEEAQKIYEVPFLIWANYDIQEEQGIYTSLNYLGALLFEKAGMTCSAYQSYLLQLRETIPAINRNGCMDNTGCWYPVSGNSGLSDQLKEYWSLEYYHIFDADRAG